MTQWITDHITQISVIWQWNVFVLLRLFFRPCRHSILMKAAEAGGISYFMKHKDWLSAILKPETVTECKHTDVIFIRNTNTRFGIEWTVRQYNGEGSRWENYPEYSWPTIDQIEILDLFHALTRVLVEPNHLGAGLLFVQPQSVILQLKYLAENMERLYKATRWI